VIGETVVELAADDAVSFEFVCTCTRVHACASVCVVLCVCERERECVCVRERERVRERQLKTPWEPGRLREVTLAAGRRSLNLTLEPCIAIFFSTCIHA
jgi:hypothetical protein